MNVRRIYLRDELVGDDGAALVMVGNRITHVEQIGVCVLALADEWISEEEIAESLVDRFGEDPHGALASTRSYCTSLVEAGLLEARVDTPEPAEHRARPLR